MSTTKFISASRLRELQRLETWRTAAAFVLDWLAIAAIIAVSKYVGGWPIYIAAIILIAGRMHAIASLIHEFAHVRFVLDRKVNDWVGDFVCAWPLFVTVDSYRRNHLQHHQHTNTEKDPDYRVKYGTARFTFPQRVANLVRNLSLYVVGVNAVRDLRTGLDRLNDKTAANKGYIAARLGFYVAAGTLLFWFGGLDELFFYWMVPYLSLFMTIMYVRSVAEHFAIENIEEKLEGTRTVIPHFWEQAFFGPHCVSYHLEHHIYPSVPFYNLPKLHAALMENPDYKARAHITRGYTTGLLRECLAHGNYRELPALAL